jgi:hypothetical protein
VPSDLSLFHSEDDIVCTMSFDLFTDMNNKSSDGNETEIEKRPTTDLSSIPNFQLNPKVVSNSPVTKCPSVTQPHAGLTLRPERELGAREKAQIFLSDLLASFASPLRLPSFTRARVSAPCPCCSVRVVVVVCGMLCLPHVSWWMSRKPSIANPNPIHSGSDLD